MDAAEIEELFASFGPVAVRRMFSGHGVYVDDACFALVLRGGIFLKADAATRDRFAAVGCMPFAYETARRAVTVESFWSLPETAFDDEDALREWCSVALEAARRTAAKKSAAAARKTFRSKAQSSARRPALQRTL